ncbi:MAG: zinc-dependent metalloprotease [Acidimicrobiia bacterium]
MADPSQPGDPDEPELPGSGGGGDPSIPGLPDFLFGGTGGVNVNFDFSQIDLSQIDVGQVMRMLQSGGPVNWEIARQTAEWVALSGSTEPDVSASDRKQFDELAHAAQTLVVGETGLTTAFAAQFATVGRQGWVDVHLVALRPVLEALAGTLGEAMRREGEEADAEDLSFELGPIAEGLPPGALGAVGGMGNMLGLLAPALLGVQAGSMIGYLAQHALGRYDLPLPTGPVPTEQISGGDAPSLCFVVSNIDEFEAAWSLTRDDLRFYVALHEVVHVAMRSVPWVRGRLVQLAVDYVSSYEIDPSAFEAEFGTLDPEDPSSIQRMTESPERVLGAMQSSRQVAPREELQRLTAVIEGYADLVLAQIGKRLIPTFDQIHEAMQRHRVERGEAERFIERLLGLKLEREHYERGQAFCAGVVTRAGLEGLNRLWESNAMLPTPNELDAPGLWLARIELAEPD